jgi:hypothetical protein
MFKQLVSVLSIVLLVGCASPATQQAMSVNLQDMPMVANAALKGKMIVNVVSGGKDTNPLWTSQVDVLSFKGALEKSIAVAGFKANDSSAAKYTIDAHLNELDQPFGGFTMNVVSTVLYTVTGAGTQKQFPVTATGTASVSDAFVGMERLRLANERSIKENIKLFLQKLTEQTGW